MLLSFGELPLIVIESKTAEAAKDEHESSLEENDLDER